MTDGRPKRAPALPAWGLPGRRPPRTVPAVAIPLHIRLHEFIADHARSVQYPRPFADVTSLPWPSRIFLGLVGVLAIATGMLLLAVAGMVLWAIFTA